MSEEAWLCREAQLVMAKSARKAAENRKEKISPILCVKAFAFGQRFPLRMSSAPQTKSHMSKKYIGFQRESIYLSSGESKKR